MRDAAPQAVYLADYTPPAYLVEAVHLTFRLAPEKTRVLSRIAFRPNPEAVTTAFALNGENLTLIGATIDGSTITLENPTDAKSLMTDVYLAAHRIEMTYIESGKPMPS